MKIAEKISERLKFKNDFEKIYFLTDTIQLDILHQLIENTGYRKTDIAKKMKVSDSFVSQLFSGDKHLSFYHLATLIYHFDLDFKFELKQKQESKEEARIINFCDYSNKGNKVYCMVGDDATKYDANKPIEEENPKTLSV